jgi:hypothetical protein
LSKPRDRFGVAATVFNRCSWVLDKLVRMDQHPCLYESDGGKDAYKFPTNDVADKAVISC